ncbi:MAG: BatA domain-containing protein [Planctomycetota bacterium]|nr:BatA domain-containing protein [Planctomycetota bacterium]
MWALLTQFFVNPAFLLGLGAVAIPVILHLRFRRTATEVPFPSLKLLQLSTRRVARRKKVEDLLLLAARALLLACLALALAKPFLKASGALASRTGVAVAIVYDNSGSMATRVGGQRRVDLARARGEEILSGVQGDGSRAGLYLAAGADPEKPGQSLTARFDDVRNALGQAEPSPRRADLAAAVARALDDLANSSEPHRELYLVTDLQARGLREALEGLKGREKSSALSVAVVPVAPGRPNDLAVTDVQVSGRGMLANVPLTVEATLRNLGEAPAEAQAELFVDGARTTARTVKVGGGSTATVAFPLRFAEGGARAAAVQVGQDENPLDDRRVLALPLEDAVRVPVIEGAASALDYQNASFYVAKALDPFAAGEGDGRTAGSGVRPLKVPEQALLGDDLGKFRAIFLLNPGKLSLEALTRLKRYVRAGGGLVIFPGDATDGPRLTQDLGLSAFEKGAPNGDGILPARLGKRFGQPVSAQRAGDDETPGVRIVDMAFTHPVLAPFKGLDRGLFTAVEAHAGFELAVPTGSPAEVLLTLDGQRPFLVGGPAGAGEVYLFASAPTPDWTNLPVRSGGIFLPLMHTLVHHLAGKNLRAGSLVVGRNVLRPAAENPQKMLLIAPDGAEQTVEAPAGQALAADLDRPGVWRLKPAHAGEPRPGPKPDPAKEPAAADPAAKATAATGPLGEDEQVFSVNPDPDEADVDALAPAEVRESFAAVAQEAVLADGPDGLAAALKRIREGVPLWNALLVCVLVLAVVEVCLGGRTAAPTGSA